MHRGISTLFPFGCVHPPLIKLTYLIGAFRHGLSYTTFEYSNLEISEAKSQAGDVEISASFTVRNTGGIAGTDVAQLYVTLPITSNLTHPPIMLKKFVKIRDLEPTKSEKVTLVLDKYAVSYWEERISRWNVEAGSYTIRVGSSSENLPLQGTFNIGKGFEWSGL